MSAYLCDPVHIGALAEWAGHPRRRSDIRRFGCEDAQDMADLLAQANLESVAYRYEGGDTDKAAQGFMGQSALDYRLSCRAASRYHNTRLGVIDRLKMIDGLEYQSCEHPGYYESDAYQALQWMRRRLIAALPGYEDAPWELTAGHPKAQDKAVSLMDLLG